VIRIFQPWIPEQKARVDLRCHDYPRLIRPS
jgi:hypothetical protein